MAEILKHPNSENPLDACEFRCDSGRVRISAPEGDVLTVERANYLLDAAKHWLLKPNLEALEDR